MALPPSVLEHLYVCRLRVLAGERAAFADDVQAAVTGSVSDKGFEAFQAHLARLRAVAEGREADEGAAGYTEETIGIVL